MNNIILWLFLCCLYVSLDVANFKVLPFRDAYAKFYKDAFSTSDNYVAALFVYTLYPLSIVYLTKSAELGDTLRKAAVLGLSGYGLYHLTNGATFPSWDWRVAAWDTAWGMVVTMILSWVAFQFQNSR